MDYVESQINSISELVFDLRHIMSKEELLDLAKRIDSFCGEGGRKPTYPTHCLSCLIHAKNEAGTL